MPKQRKKRNGRMKRRRKWRAACIYTYTYTCTWIEEAYSTTTGATWPRNHVIWLANCKVRGDAVTLHSAWLRAFPLLLRHISSLCLLDCAGQLVRWHMRATVSRAWFVRSFVTNLAVYLGGELWKTFDFNRNDRRRFWQRVTTTFESACCVSSEVW